MVTSGAIKLHLVIYIAFIFLPHCALKTLSRYSYRRDRYKYSLHLIGLFHSRATSAYSAFIRTLPNILTFCLLVQFRLSVLAHQLRQVPFPPQNTLVISSFQFLSTSISVLIFLVSRISHFLHRFCYARVLISSTTLLIISSLESLLFSFRSLVSFLTNESQLLLFSAVHIHYLLIRLFFRRLSFHLLAPFFPQPHFSGIALYTFFWTNPQPPSHFDVFFPLRPITNLITICAVPCFVRRAQMCNATTTKSSREYLSSHSCKLWTRA